MTGDGRQENNPTSEDFNWKVYYEATAGRDVRPLLAQATRMMEIAGDALELGAGAGNEVRYLLERGYRVTAVDADAGAVKRLQALAHPNLRVVQSTYDAFPFQPDTYDLVSAHFALPFNPAATFDAMFTRLRRSIRPGGLFSGNLFGERDGWNVPGSGKTFLRREDAIRLFDGLDVLLFNEIEDEHEMAHGGIKRWHMFDIIARRPAPADQ